MKLEDCTKEEIIYYVRRQYFDLDVNIERADKRISELLSIEQGEPG